MSSQTEEMQPQYADESYFIFKPTLPKDRQEREALRFRNNPNREPVGKHTGRCRHCGSKELSSDNLAYWCNGCGAMLGSN